MIDLSEMPSRIDEGLKYQPVADSVARCWIAANSVCAGTPECLISCSHDENETGIYLLGSLDWFEDKGQEAFLFYIVKSYVARYVYLFVVDGDDLLLSYPVAFVEGDGLYASVRLCELVPEKAFKVFSYRRTVDFEDDSLNAAVLNEDSTVRVLKYNSVSNRIDTLSRSHWSKGTLLDSFEIGK